ncbi:FAD binding domain-containing protein [Paraliomyxa miuraensis]|uniref:FAD binding domain-containing protein n=1 Tax=Paraliomyxa miuraensis TaxID=376150 RepID=UPI00225812AD|nr:FAD binding domain-containing protein [Paraliomyxa miuraensis]MCX4240987.1 FAD binding domain-containing protein [Paraliomyxa miuraensis]
MPRFSVQTPRTIDEVVQALRTPGARLVAGGTDLLPNIKHRLEQPPVLVSLSRVRELGDVVVDEAAGVMRIGARVTLTAISEHAQVRERFPSLARAAGVVASPLIRNMGTLGGNVNLDTRCRYVNQTAFWREALGGGCIKSEGSVCHVVPGGRNCVAAMSSDCVPVLISLGASIVLVGSQGRRELPLEDYYLADGVRHTTRLDDELTTELVVPLPRGPRRSHYAKWTVRGSIDFPLVSVALRFDLEQDHVSAPVSEAHVVVGVLGSKPRRVTRLDDVVGKALDDPSLATAVAERVHQQCKPLENVPYEAPYRRTMLRVHARRAIEVMVAAG